MKHARTAGVVLALIAMAFSLVGCENGEDVTVVNSSTEVVVVFENDVPVELVQPRVSLNFFVPELFTGTFTYKVESFDTRRVLASRSFTWDEIHSQHGLTLVIQ